MIDQPDFPDDNSPFDAAFDALSEAWVASTVILLAGDEMRTEMFFSHLENLATAYRNSGRTTIADILDGLVAQVELGTAQIRHAIDNP